jgi:hypothetical protein
MPAIIALDDARYALNLVKAICTQVGPGLPGTTQERQRAAVIAEQLALHLGAGDVALEEFRVAPWAWLSAYPLSALFLLVAALLNVAIGRFTGVSPALTASAALVFAVLAPLPFIFVFILNHEWLDPFFRQKPSVTVVGRLRQPATNDVKRLLILSGHHDSASENTWLRFLGYGFFVLTAAWFLAFVVMLVISTIQLTGVILGNDAAVRLGTLGWVLLVFPIVPAVLYGLFFNRGRKNGGTVPGATDNLAACALVVTLCRFLVQNPACIPPDTEIRFITFGSEEAGVRGSRRYVQRHLDELRRLDARLLNFEMVAYPEIAILTSDAHGTVKNSPEMVESVVAAAARAGVPHKVRAASLGTATDAGPFSQAGLKATTLIPFKFPQQMVAFYHQKWDNPDILTIEPLLNVLKLSCEWVCHGGDAANDTGAEP